MKNTNPGPIGGDPLHGFYPDGMMEIAQELLPELEDGARHTAVHADRFRAREKNLVSDEKPRNSAKTED